MGGSEDRSAGAKAGEQRRGGSRAEAIPARKEVREVEGGFYAASAEGFVGGAPLVFQPARAGDLSLTVAFTFVRPEGEVHATFRIAGGRLTVEHVLAPDAELRIRADERTRLGVVRRYARPRPPPR